MKSPNKYPAWLPRVYGPKAHKMATKLSSSAELSKLGMDLHKEWEANLKAKGVKWPGTSQISVLLCLYEADSKPRSQSDIESWFRKHSLGQYNRQIRHVSASGWLIMTGNSRGTRMPIDPNLKSDQIRLASTVEANPLHAPGRAISISSSSWNDILKLFEENGRGCAVCGNHRASYDKGHLDPTKEGDAGNLVPMCPDCNNWGAARDMAFELDPRNLIARPKISRKI